VKNVNFTDETICELGFKLGFDFHKNLMKYLRKPFQNIKTI